jgi:hypothetical protein
LSHCAFLSHSQLSFKYLRVLIETFRTYIRTTLNSSMSKFEMKQVSMFINELVVMTKDTIDSLRNKETNVDFFVELLRDIKVIVNRSANIDLTEKAEKILGSSYGHKPSVGKVETALDKVDDCSEFTQLVISGEPPQKPESSVTRRERFVHACSEVTKTAGYQQMVLNEFQELMKRGNHVDSREDFKDFLQNLLRYLKNGKLSSRSLEIIGIKVVNNFVVSEQTSRGFAKSSFKYEIPNVLVKILASPDTDQEIFFMALRTAIECLQDVEPTIQETFLAAIQKIDRHGVEFLTIILRYIHKLLFNIEKSMGRINKHEMIQSMLGQGELKNQQNSSHNIDEHVKKCESIFQFLRLLCEGHNPKLQNFMRAQSKEKASKEVANINMLVISCELISSFTKYLNKQCLTAVVEIVNFLIETVQGPCRSNQLCLIECKIVDCCKEFLTEIDSHPEDLASKGFDKNDPECTKVLGYAIYSMVKLMISILEGGQNQEFLKEIGKSFEFDTLANQMSLYYVLYFTEYLKIDEGELLQKDPTTIVMLVKEKFFNEDILRGFSVYRLIKEVEGQCPEYTEMLAKLEGINRCAFKFFEANSCHIEIVFEGNLQLTYFPKHPSCNYLPDFEKERLLNTIRRDHHNEKISDLITASSHLFTVMCFLMKMENKYKLKHFFVSYLRASVLVLCYVLNTIIFVRSDFVVEKGWGSPSLHKTEELIIRILGTLL